jgi:hypothetical protein
MCLFFSPAEKLLRKTLNFFFEKNTKWKSQKGAVGVIGRREKENTTGIPAKPC